MNEGKKYSIGLFIKILVILSLPLLLFRYVEMQPETVTINDNEEATRSIAVVNEDTPVKMNDEMVELGKEIPELLTNQEDYSWTVVNRSAAEQGLESQKYDAIIYIPSSYSENVMTFKQENPSKASIRYVIQPKLDAKNRQRVHKEMANAKSRINQEMSTIYWSYVSQEIDNIREQFTTILEKEIGFQEAMNSFYTPSSKTLESELGSLTNKFENIKKRTDTIDESSESSVSAIKEAEDKLNQFIDELNSYKEIQQRQQELLIKVQVENQDMVTSTLDDYQQALTKNVANSKEQLAQNVSNRKEQLDQLSNSVVVMEKQSNILLNGLKGNIQSGKQVIANWIEWKENYSIVSSSEEDIKNILKSYNQKTVDNATSEMYQAIQVIQGKPDITTPKLIEPIEPNGDGEISVGQLDVRIKKLEEAISTVKDAVGSLGSGDETDPPVPTEPESESGNGEVQPNSETSVPPEEVEPVVDWTQVNTHMDSLKKEVADLKEQNNNSALIEWKEYAKSWEKVYRELLKTKVNPNEELLNEIAGLQKELNLDFPETGEIKNKSVGALTKYYGALSEYQTVLTATGAGDNKLVEELLNTQFSANQATKEEIFDAVGSMYTVKLQQIFGMSDSEVQAIENENKSFSDIANNIKQSLNDYQTMVKTEQLNTNNTLEQIKSKASEITAQLSEVGSDNLELNELNSENLDGQMVFHIQQNTASNLTNLSKLVSNLEESQSSVTGSLADLQKKVGNVQQQSDVLNNKWSANVATTQRVKEDVYNILGNTIIDGQTNSVVYDYLASPVQMQGQVNGEVLSEKEEEQQLPPVIMFIVILISGLLIGFLSNYYGNTSYLVQGGLFLLLNLAAGIIISIYGLSIYSLEDAQAIKWTIFTVLLLMACSNIVRAGLFIAPFVGWLASIVMIVFFITPLIDIVVPKFSFENPIADGYMSLQYGFDYPLYMTMGIILAITILVSVFIYTFQVIRNKAEVSTDEEKAS
ncbi:type VII secretion protein EsaA [Virgibacillus necropolis]|uniref:Type VII secretion protein EsaA n=1 Tax=Virgibacillus necropolis TaxID=163877 RepID=A0A221MEI8_9BACI|nr:type VII secretion protein EsaA [Virgibacillus necropolis]ASN06083.1 type VII secretion protein EsaA [Virgibacillus necropolis]